ncbi:hypothetical protein QMO56_19505 [Roseomonas sp. E05]|uniref:hypothetical protein n=1 Tax=Roseomonas sp. E05 TaxID=3046310 RepID=UPI0024BBCD34|nr:hypothetical protein [Roseomonas sp. E05]MDJ0390302.1 hypothetical protein [Roseomonas sp. E05]
MALRRPSLERRILAAFQHALAEGRFDVAEHLLCALETLVPDGAPGTALSAAYLSAAEPDPQS